MVHPTRSPGSMARTVEGAQAKQRTELQKFDHKVDMQNWRSDVRNRRSRHGFVESGWLPIVLDTEADGLEYLHVGLDRFIRKCPAAQ